MIGLEGVERVVATATEGVGFVSIEMATLADSDAVLNAVRNAVDAIENFPPPNAERPEIELARVSVEAMTLAVSSSVASENQLRLAAEDVRSALLGLPSVSLVELQGTRDREIAIEISEEELRRNGLTIAQVSAAVQRASLNLTFGELRTESGGVVLHTVAKRSIGEEFEDIPLITRLDGAIVMLGDVAAVRDGFVDDELVSEVNGAPAVFVRIDAADEQSIVALTDDIRNWLAGYEPPQDVAVSIWNDPARPALDRLSAVARNGLAGVILVFVLLLFVFDLRAATWITAGIPFSFIGRPDLLQSREPDPEPGNVVRVLPDGRPRRGRRPGGRGEHRRGTRQRQERRAGGFRGGQGGGRSHHHRRMHHAACVRAVPLRDRIRNPAGVRIHVRRVLRARRVAHRGVPHSARPSLA